MKRSEQKFKGVLSDEELNLVEDGLIALRALYPERKAKANKLISKLYKFWETV